MFVKEESIMKKRLLFASGLFVAILLILVAFTTAQAKKAPLPELANEWRVRSGDTLWHIAAQNRGRTDIRRYIYEIQKLNDLGSTIYPGQTLLLPPSK